MKIAIISYCDHLRTNAHINHQYYADKHGYSYIYDISPTKNSKYMAKLEKILKYFNFFDYIFWIDDDAIFCNFETELESFIKPFETMDFIFCKSPINLEGGWTYLSSGNFIIKCTENSKKLLHNAILQDLNIVREWWDHDVYGLFTNGDQDCIIYDLVKANQAAKYHRYEYNVFNTRKYHFDQNLPISQHFLCHFTGGDKHEQIQEFGKKYGLNEFLIPEPIQVRYKHYVENKKQDIVKIEQKQNCSIKSICNFFKKIISYYKSNIKFKLF